MNLDKKIVFPALVSFIFSIAAFEAAGQEMEGKPEAKKEAKKEKKKQPSKADKKKAAELHAQAVSLYKEGKYGEAVEYFKQADEIDPNPFASYNMARCYEKVGKDAEAYEYYRQYIESGDKAKADDAAQAMSRIEEKLGLPKYTPGAVKEAPPPEEEKKVAKDDSKKAEEFHAEAVRLYKEEKYDGAIEYFKKANEIVSTPFNLYNIARCYDKMYKLKEAHDHYQAYVETGDATKVDDALAAMERIENIPALLNVVTTPDGADVYINGEIVEHQKTPVVHEIKAGKTYAILVKKEGFREAEREVEAPYGGEVKLEVGLEPVEETAVEAVKKVEPVVERKGKKPLVPLSVGFAAGATVSTSSVVASYIDASIAVSYMIKQAFVGVGIDNLFFNNSYILAAYPAGGYRLKVWRDLEMELAGGFGFLYLQAFVEGGEETDDGGRKVLVNKGFNWDLVAHVEARVRYRVGPILVQAIPVHANILTGLGEVKAAPLAQFAFLAGLAYDF